MTTTTETLTDFLTRMLADDERMAPARHTLLCMRTACDREGCIWGENEEAAMERERVCTCGYPARVLADVAARRAIVEWHKNWPVLVESPPEFETVGSDLDSMTMRVSQRIEWITEQEYREKFGSEPPTSPILKMLAAPYSSEPGYDAERWAVS